MRSTSNNRRTPDATGLIGALHRAAADRRHTNADVARVLGITPSHLYRLNADPAALGRCTPKTLRALSDYLGWPLAATYLEAGLLKPAEMVHWLPESELADALADLERSPLIAGVALPVRAAAEPHQRLMVMLYRFAQAQALRPDNDSL
jgi:hypothetical protein